LVFLTHQSVQIRKALSVKVSHRFGVGSAVFDDDRLVSCAGLVPVMALAEQTGLSRLIAEKVRIAEPRIASGAANPAPKLATQREELREAYEAEQTSDQDDWGCLTLGHRVPLRMPGRSGVRLESTADDGQCARSW
jgi:hypothetical protein